MELEEIHPNQIVAHEIRSKHSATLAFAKKLHEAVRVLDILVDDYSDYQYRPPKRLRVEDSQDNSSIGTRLKVSDILSYSRRISYTTFAPPEFGAGTAPLRGVLPPAPQEQQMRASQLYKFADLDVGLAKSVKGKEEFAIFEPLLAQNPVAINDMLLPNIVVPSGWKPGMPVQLPADLRILPPAGWKTGDPVSLPPLGVSQPIQVRHVQLDIEDDSSSEYSSDDESSIGEDR